MTTHNDTVVLIDIHCINKNELQQGIRLKRSAEATIRELGA